MKCTQCGTVLAGTNPRKRFCSKKCGNRARYLLGSGATAKRREVRAWASPTAAQRAWLAGILEGEGTFSGRNGYPSIHLQMCDQDVVDRCREITGVGLLYGPYSPPSRVGKKPTYHWNVTTTGEVLTVLGAIAPHLGARRRQQVTEMLTKWSA